MSAFCHLERELAHISAMVALLETRTSVDVKSPVKDPAYWRAIIQDSTRQAALDRVLQQRVTNLIAQFDGIPTAPPGGTHAHKPSWTFSRVAGKRAA